MMPPGRLLADTRINKEISFEQIERVTNISKASLQALENDDSSFFASETYYIGFLKVYGEFLGIDISSLLQAHESIKKIEVPIPIEALTGKEKIPGTRKNTKVFFTLAIGLFGAAGITLFILAGGIFPRITLSRNSEKRSLVYEISEFPWKMDISQKSDLWVSFNEETIWQYTVANVGEDLFVESITAPLKIESTLSSGETLTIGPPRQSVVFLYEKPTLIIERLLENPASNEKREGIKTELRSGVDVPVDVNLSLNFLKSAYFRHEVDDNPPIEGFYNSSRNLSINGRSLQIGVSNAGAVDVLIDGEGVSLGRNGELVAAKIEWKKKDLDYSLILTRLY